MADRSSRRGGRPQRDRGSERRGGVGYRDDRDRRRYDDDNDRDNRRRYRSRSRDRERDSGRSGRDRDNNRRDRSRSRDRPPRGPRGARDGGDRDHYDSRRARNYDGRGGKGDGGDKHRKDHRRRSASPGRSASPATAELPTRGKPDIDRHGAQSSMAVQVDGKDREGNRGRGQQQPGREDSYHDERDREQERDEPRTRDGGEPMDEDENLDVEDDGMGNMAAMMGFGGFGSTKGKKVVGNNVGAVRKEKKTEYRQYMNRVGGFNRPLSPSR